MVAELAARADAIRLGNGLDPASQTGPLVSAAHRAKIEDFVASARAEGAAVLAGGCRPDDPELAEGLLLPAHRADGCHRDMRVVREETFGPILTVERFATEDEAVALGNDTDYGLAGAVWSGDVGRRTGWRPRCATARCGSTTSAPMSPGGVGRHEALGQRPRARPDRAARVPGAEAHLAQHGARACAVVRKA